MQDFAKGAAHSIVMTLALSLPADASTGATLPWERAAPAVGAYARPEPLHDVTVQRNVPIPMRDGVHLATDVYMPVGPRERLPTIYIATPYNKAAESAETVARFFAGQGYVVAYQDVRGKFRSQGHFVVEHDSGPDGFDTVEWLSKQPWSNQRVGTFGCSYLGQTQVYLAKHRPPALKAMISAGAGGMGGTYRPDGANGPRFGGAVMLSAAFPWVRDKMMIHRTGVEGWGRDESAAAALPFFDPQPILPAVDYSTAYYHLPLSTIMEATGSPPNDWARYIGKGYTDPWWKTFDRPDETDTIDVPTLHINSWHDYGVTGTLYFWQLFSKISASALARDNQYLIIAPTTHCAYEIVTEHSTVGELDIGDARFDFYQLYLRWFSHWLRDTTPRDFSDLPKVLYYSTGVNQWQKSQTWPPQGLQSRRLHLHSGGRANSLNGDGRLSVAPSASAAADEYTYDPLVPTLAIGGTAWGIGDTKDGSFEQRAVEVRSDVLVYTSDTLARPLHMAGPLSVMLHFSTSTPDTDIVAKLVDVFPDGRAFNIQEGILRLRYREGYDHEVRAIPGHVYEVRVPMRETSHVFAPGHRIRLDLSSASFPTYDRNLNTGGDNFTEHEPQVAVNRVRHGGPDASRLEFLSKDDVTDAMFGR